MLTLNFNLTARAQYRSEALLCLLRADHFFWLVTEAVLALPATVGHWLRRRHTRQVLAALDDHQLRDIGLTRAELSKLLASANRASARIASHLAHRQ
jgi:uncharacterized protein YjiS (DUF1127 family)